MYKLIDTHAHLDQIIDLESALKRAKEAGVEKIIAVATDYNSCIRLLDIKKSNYDPEIFIALGVHPTEIKSNEIEKTLNLIEENKKNIIAIGEIGLDYWHKSVKKDKSKKEQQEEVFSQQLKIAKKYNLPVIIHSRGSWQDCLKLCLEYEIKMAVFHWYSGPIDILKKILTSNFFISATPSLGYSPQHQAAIQETPLDRLLLETDSPVFFGDVPNNGFKAEPKDVIRTLDLVSKLKNISQEKIITQTNKNAETVFNIKLN